MGTLTGTHFSLPLRKFFHAGSFGPSNAPFGCIWVPLRAPIGKKNNSFFCTLQGNHPKAHGHPHNEGNLTPDLLDPTQIRQLLRHILLTMSTPSTYLGEGVGVRGKCTHAPGHMFAGTTSPHLSACSHLLLHLFWPKLPRYPAHIRTRAHFFFFF